MAPSFFAVDAFIVASVVPLEDVITLGYWMRDSAAQPISARRSCRQEVRRVQVFVRCEVTFDDCGPDSDGTIVHEID